MLTGIEIQTLYEPWGYTKYRTGAGKIVLVTDVTDAAARAQMLAERAPAVDEVIYYKDAPLDETYEEIK